MNALGVCCPLLCSALLFHPLAERRQQGLGGPCALGDRLFSSVKLQQLNMPQRRGNEEIRRICGQPVFGDAILHHVE